MADSERDLDETPEPTDAALDSEQDSQREPEGEEAGPQKLTLDVQIENRSACERHITVRIDRQDIDRYLNKEYSELMPSAQVPGFRPGRAPRKLVENRFRKEIGEKVKSELLMDSLGQLNDDYKLSAISEPDVDLEAVELPDEGPMSFEFNLEVRPEFDLPKWKGLTIERPNREITGIDVDAAMSRLREGRGRLVPLEGPAEPGDFITCNITCRDGQRVISTVSDQQVRLRATLSFPDGKIEGFSAKMAGVAAGQRRTTDVVVAADALDESLRGKTVSAEFEVLDVKRLERAELTPELLDEIGGFSLEADLRDAIKDTLARRLEYQQRRRVREQISALLIEAANWELPPGLLQRQSSRELQRAVLEMQRSGYSDDEIQAHENELRQNSRASTARALKEHFILERIAEDQSIEADEADYDSEIALIAAQSGESPRRVRAKLEKSGSMDVLRNQIIEQKVIERIIAEAQFKDLPFEFEESDVAAIDAPLCGHGAEIPEAQPGGATAAPGGRPEEPRFHG